MKIAPEKPIMITGATGYVAGWIVKKFLEEGHTVHAPIRNINNTEKRKYIDAVALNTKGTIRYFEADLLKSCSYDEAMEGCELVIHTASPFIANPKNAQRDLIDPALQGTQNVLNSVNKIPSVKRVVLTSSVAAIYGDAKDVLNYPNQMMTEKQWNTTSSLDRSPYNYSKVLAEKKAWEINEKQSRWDLVTINPSLVLGPSLNPKATSESLNILKQFGDGRMKLGAPDLAIGCVDIRDVAEAHYRAGFVSSAKGRYITNAENLTLLKLANMLRPSFGKKYPIPKKRMPKWLIWLMAPIAGASRQFVSDNIGYPWKADNSKIKRELGIEFKPISTSINEFFRQLIDHKII